MLGAHRENTTPAWEFYDLQTDPYENHHAFFDMEYADIIATMKQEMIDLRVSLGDTDERFPEMELILSNNLLN